MTADSPAPTEVPDLHDAMHGTLHYELRRAAGALTGLMTGLFARHGLKPSEATLLMAIGHNPGCTQSDIARLHRSQAANLVPLVAKLERDGLLDRAPGRGRAIALSVSGKGAGLLAEVEADFAKLENHLGAALAPVERAQAIAVLRGLCDAACHFRRD